jgi:hypothetical protein
MDRVPDDGLVGASRGDTALDQVLSGGHSQTVGQFRFYIDDERWEWSDEVQQMHGYVPGSLPNPTTAQVLSLSIPKITRMSRAPWRTLDGRGQRSARGTA